MTQVSAGAGACVASGTRPTMHDQKLQFGRDGGRDGGYLSCVLTQGFHQPFRQPAAKPPRAGHTARRVPVPVPGSVGGATRPCPPVQVCTRLQPAPDATMPLRTRCSTQPGPGPGPPLSFPYAAPIVYRKERSIEREHQQRLRQCMAGSLMTHLRSPRLPTTGEPLARSTSARALPPASSSLGVSVTLSARST